MMPAIDRDTGAGAPRLVDRLPSVRGRLTEGALLSKVTWFRVGGAGRRWAVSSRPTPRI